MVSMITITMALVSFLLLAFPVQLHGLPGLLRTHDGVMTDNQELENALVQALLAVSQQWPRNQQLQYYDSANTQQFTILPRINIVWLRISKGIL